MEPKFEPQPFTIEVDLESIDHCVMVGDEHVATVAWSHDAQGYRGRGWTPRGGSCYFPETSVLDGCATKADAAEGILRVLERQKIEDAKLKDYWVHFEATFKRMVYDVPDEQTAIKQAREKFLHSHDRYIFVGDVELDISTPRAELTERD